MNFQNLNFEHVEEGPLQWPPQFHTSKPSVSHQHTSTTYSTNHTSHTQHSRPNSLSPQPTTLPIDRPRPSSSQASSSSFSSDTTDEERDGHIVPPTPRASQPNRFQTLSAPAVRFDESQLALFAAMNPGSMHGLKDDLAMAAGKVTPGVDDSPYIQYAIDALTRNRNRTGSEGDDESSDGGDFEEEMAHYAPPATQQRTSGSTVELGYAVPIALPPATTPTRQPKKTSSESKRSSNHYNNNTVNDNSNYNDDSNNTANRKRSTSYNRPSPIQTQPKNELLVVRPTPPLSPFPQVSRPIRSSHQNRSSQVTSGTTAQTTPEPLIAVTKHMRESFCPNEKAYPPLTYKPCILRPFSMLILISLCLLMTAGLITSAVYSKRHTTGLLVYPDTIYSGQYFLFRLMPQLLAAVILIYAQAVVTTSLRILPFVSMASEDARDRYLALFQRLYTYTFLWPRMVGPWQFKVFSVATWLMLFTVPLQSAAFTCIFVQGQWVWAPVQGVVWVLVALYLVMILATVPLMVFWFGKWTGILWDMRSVGDLLSLLNRSNTMHSYRGKELLESGAQLKDELRERWFDRLGYWRTDNEMQARGIWWYGIGSSASKSETGADSDGMFIQGSMRDVGRVSLESHSIDAFTDARYRYLPWCLRDGPVTALMVGSTGILIALLIVSFLPETRLEAGFLPLVPSKPSSSGFSAANFLYSFMPSMLGMIFFLLFQSLDQALRILQPWGSLSEPDGGLARKSIMADYAACLPLQAAWRAARVGHWRVAIVSAMATVFMTIPVLAGGVFMALTNPDGQVRMYPNIPVYGVLLAMLFLYVASVTVVVPRRCQFLLPHSVDCLADIFGFCSAEELTQDAAFRAVKSRGDLKTRLGANGVADARYESLWFFGFMPGKDERILSVRRLRRFTDKMIMKRSLRSVDGSMV